MHHKIKFFDVKNYRYPAKLQESILYLKITEQYKKNRNIANLGNTNQHIINNKSQFVHYNKTTYYHFKSTS